MNRNDNFESKYYKSYFLPLHQTFYIMARTLFSNYSCLVYYLPVGLFVSDEMMRFCILLQYQNGRHTCSTDVVPCRKTNLNYVVLHLSQELTPLKMMRRQFEIQERTPEKWPTGLINIARRSPLLSRFCLFRFPKYDAN